MTSIPRLLDMLSDASGRASRDIDVRDRLIKRLADRGVSLRTIAARAHVSHETVRKIVGGASSRPRRIRVD